MLRTISSRIEAGIYSTGERIPTEPMLAKEFGVARETLRGALEILEKRGLIQRFPGRARTSADGRRGRGSCIC
ncbi:MAG: GntR family transcriptional regulator [Lentisphaeria bacterium]|nr:MAG: GntR family transcriptional regulator [Lentisphaeria bacterium]